MALVSRDPFAREEIHRHLVEDNGQCDWCGNFRRADGKIHKLWKFTVESDGGRKNDIRGLFCCVQCMRDYHS